MKTTLITNLITINNSYHLSLLVSPLTQRFLPTMHFLDVLEILRLDIECFHCHAIKNKIKNHSVDIKSRNSDIIDDR